MGRREIDRQAIFNKKLYLLFNHAIHPRRNTRISRRNIIAHCLPYEFAEALETGKPSLYFTQHIWRSTRMRIEHCNSFYPVYHFRRYMDTRFSPSNNKLFQEEKDLISCTIHPSCTVHFLRLLFL